MASALEDPYLPMLMPWKILFMVQKKQTMNMTWKYDSRRRRGSMRFWTGWKSTIGIGRTIPTKTSKCSSAQSWILLTGQPASCTLLVLAKIKTTSTVIFCFVAIG
jgi:hypothetical protein